jgi:uncharacterized membrane protein YbhN (UPF0104 family)
MFIILFGIYIFFLTIIWTFFILSKIYADKFIIFNKNIKKVNTFFLAFLIVLTILWIVMISLMDFKKTISVDYNKDINSIIHY